MKVLTFGPRIDIYEGPIASASSVPLWVPGMAGGQFGVAIDALSQDTPPEKTRRGGRPKREAMTLTGLHQKFLLYCEVERQLSPQTIVSYRSDFEQFKAALREHGRLGLARQDTGATFSVEAVRDYQYDMVPRGWSRATCRRRLIQLNRFGTWLVKRGHLKANPLAEIEIPRREKRLPKVLPWSVAEEVVAGESRARNRAILALLVYAALRRGEVVQLDVGSLLREGDVALRVRGKGNKERVVGLTSQAVTAIDAYLATRPGAQPDEPMFVVSGGRRITARVVTKAVARAARRLKVHLYPHLFRHTCATRLHELDEDLRVIQEMLGHESVATTQIYTRVSPSRQRRADSEAGRGVFCVGGSVPPWGPNNFGRLKARKETSRQRGPVSRGLDECRKLLCRRDVSATGVWSTT